MAQKQDHTFSPVIKADPSPPLGTVTASSEGHSGVQSTQQRKVSTASGVTPDPPKYLGLICAEISVLAKTSAASNWEGLSNCHHFLPLSKPLSDCLSKALGRQPLSTYYRYQLFSVSNGNHVPTPLTCQSGEGYVPFRSSFWLADSQTHKGGELAQLVQSLSCKYEDLSSRPRAWVKNPGAAEMALVFEYLTTVFPSTPVAAQKSVTPGPGI